MDSDLPHATPVSDGPPPFLGTWQRVYAAVLAILALVVAALYGFSRLFFY